VLRVGVRDEKPVRAGLVTRDDVRRTRQGQVDQVGAAGRVAGGGQGVDDAERAVRQVVEPGRDPGADLPVHATRRRFRCSQVRRHGQDGQVQVACPRGAQR
jgi:hypothetical protein